MKAIELTAPTIAAFRLTELPEPTVGRGEVLVRMRAATLNFIDIAIATGNFPGARFPMIPVSDGAGEIAALGEGVHGWAVGERVIPHFMPNWDAGPITQRNVAAMRGVTLPGSLVEYVAVPAASLVSIPEHLDFAQGASLPIAATTAWNALRSAQVRPGSVVVLLGTGGVSIVALQLAKASGATVILASSSDDKLERARQIGADHLINYRATPAWDARVLELTAGRGADLVIDTVGSATIVRSLNAAAMGGTVFTVGFISGSTASLDMLPVIVKALRIVGNNTGSVANGVDLSYFRFSKWVALWCSFNDPVEFSAGSFYSELGHEPLPHIFKHLWQRPECSRCRRPDQFILDGMEGTHETDVGRSTPCFKCSFGHLQPYQIVGNHGAPNFLFDSSNRLATQR